MLGCGLARWNMRSAGATLSYPNLKSFIGIVAIVSSVALLSTGDHFSGWPALLPTSGAFLLIAAGPAAAINKFVFSRKVVVAIGLISYPLYLWHWPLLLFLRVMEGDALPASGAALAVFLSLILAYLTHVAVERNVKHLHGGMVAPTLCAILATVGFGGLTIRQYNGVSARAINQLNV
jgi:peptidoglycan/LPS O-acetylase OafA/YrhL